MKLIETRKAEKIIKEIEQKTGELLTIRFGSPDARFSKRYWLIATTKDGFQAPGTYGYVVNSGKTLESLLNYNNETCGISGFCV